MKQSVKQMLQMLPEYCLVGLITFGAMVKGTRNPCMLYINICTVPYQAYQAVLACPPKHGVSPRLPC